MNEALPTPTETLGEAQRADFVALVFPDIVGSTALKPHVGDKPGAALIRIRVANPV